MKPTYRFLICLAVGILTSTCLLTAQVVATGTPAFNSFGGGPFDVVNLGNLNVHASIPIRHKPGRGTPFVYDLVYESSIWTPSNGNWTPITSLSGQQAYWGWLGLSNGASGSPYVTYTMTYTTSMCGQYGNQPVQQWQFSNFVYHDELGLAHQFGNVGGTIYNSPGPPNCPPNGTFPPGTQTGNTSDSSGYIGYINIYQGYASGYITSKDGRTIYPNFSSNPPAQQTSFYAYDSNGNKITVSSGSYTDTLGQTALTVAGSAPSNTTLTYTPPAGGNAIYTVSYKGYTVKTAFQCTGIADYTSPSTVYLVDKITLPDSSFYQFAYENTPGYSDGVHVTARVSQVTLPTGGTIYYQYTGSNNGIVCSDGSAAGLKRTIGTSGPQWTYARNQGSGNAWTTTITDPNTNQTVIQFQKDTASYSFYETERQVYQGATVLSTKIQCYNTASPTPSSCPTTSVSSPITRLTAFNYLPDTSGKVAETDTQYDYSGDPTEVDSYDFGSGSPPAVPTRKVITAFGLYGSAMLPTSITTEDGSNNVKDYTTFSYDQSTPAASTGTPQHVTGVNHGNLTTISQQVSGTVTLYRTFTYYDTGTPRTATDWGTSSSGGPNITTYNYPDANSTCGNAFATSLTLPILGTTPSTTFNCPGAVATQTKDLNGNATNIAYNDAAYWRPVTSTDPLSNVTNFAYTPTSFERWVTFGSSIAESFTMTDSFGRSFLSQRQQNTWPSNFDTVSRTYDSVGRVASVSMPCSTTWKSGCPSSPATSTTYDALNRPTQIVDGGGGTITYTYTQNDVLQALGPNPNGENLKRRQFEYDGFGRLTSVCEITTASGSGPCGQFVGQTGFLTRYTYDVLGNLTGVTQNAQGSPTQTRSYSYDMLRRLTSETNPESGTTTYLYDSASGDNCRSALGTSGGDLVRKTDANGNYVCYLYDGLHRLTDVGNNFDNASNPCKRFRYDNTSGILGTRPTGVTITNSLSQVAEAETDNCTWPITQASMITDEWFSYSARGELTDLYESTPHSGGYYHVSTGYFANGALQALNNIGNGYNYGFGVDGEGRPKSAALTNSTLTNYVSNVTYNPGSQPLTVSFASGDSDTYTYDPNTGRMSTYTFTVGSTPKSMVGTLTWNSNGTLSKLAVTDAFNASGTQTCKYGDPSASVAGYDDLSRLVSANCGSVWSQSFTYDPFGNITKSGTSAWMPGYNQSNNRYTLAGTTYDADGNLLTDTFHSYTWNVYSRPATVDGTTTLTYDAIDTLVEKGVSGTYTEFEYGPTGRTCTMNGTAQVQCITPLPGGSALARGPETIWHPDWLGSPRLGSSPSNRTVTFDRAFAPFGEAYDTVTGGTTNLSFTGLLQDSVSGEYDTPARLLHPGQGRWISPDPAGLAAADPGNPQSWNRYAYVVNNPLALIDPTGLDYCSGNSPYTSGGGGTENLPAPWCSQICALGYLAACEGYYNAFEGLQAMVNSLGGIGGGFLPGENSINWPLGTGNLFGDIWNALGLPSGLSCPQVGGVSNFLCGGINPIMDSNPPGVDPNVVCDDNGNCTTFDEVQVTDKEPSSLLHLSKDDCEKLSGDIEQAGAIAGAAGVPFLPFKEAGIKVKVPKILTRWALPVAAAAVTFALSEAAFKAVGRCYW